MGVRRRGARGGRRRDRRVGVRRAGRSPRPCPAPSCSSSGVGHAGRRSREPARGRRRGSRRMADRPYTLLSCGMSIDGYLDRHGERLVLSNDADLERVDRSARRATRSSSGPRPSGRTTRACWSAARPGATSARRGLPPDHRSRSPSPRGARAGPARRLLRHRRQREARLLRQAGGRGPRERLGDGRDGRRRRAAGRSGGAGGGPPRPRRAPADGRGWRQRSTPSSYRRASPTSCTSWSRRSSSATPGPTGSSGTALPLEHGPPRQLAEVRRSATSCCSVTRSPGPVTGTDDAAAAGRPPRGPDAGRGAAAVRRRLRDPRRGRSPSPGSSTAASTSRCGLGERRLARRGDAPTARPAPQRVPHRRRLRQRALRLRPAAARVGRADRRGRRLLLYLRQEGRGIGLYAKLDAYALQDAGLDTYDANIALGYGADERDYTVAAQMLRRARCRRVALLTNNPDKVRPARAPGIDVAARADRRAPQRGQRPRTSPPRSTRGSHLSSSPSIEAGAPGTPTRA